MDFKFSSKVTKAQREDSEEVGVLGQYTITYVDNAVQTVRVTELSERLPTKRSLGMELVFSDPHVPYTARTDLIILSAVTHGDRPAVYVELSSDFSSDASIEVIEDSKFKKRDFLDDLKRALQV